MILDAPKGDRPFGSLCRHLPLFEGAGSARRPLTDLKEGGWPLVSCNFPRWRLLPPFKDWGHS